MDLLKERSFRLKVKKAEMALVTLLFISPRGKNRNPVNKINFSASQIHNVV